MLLWSLMVGVWSFAPPASAADTNSILAAWLNAQTNVQTWSADFLQTRKLKSLTQPLTATGHVWFAAPNRFHWELGQPAQTIAVRTTNDLLVIYPRLKRVERYPLSGGAMARGAMPSRCWKPAFPAARLSCIHNSNCSLNKFPITSAKSRSNPNPPPPAA